MRNARAPAVINHCSSCKRHEIESGPIKPGSGVGSLIGNSLDMGAPLAQWMMRIESRGVRIGFLVSIVGVGSAGYNYFSLLLVIIGCYGEDDQAVADGLSVSLISPACAAT